MVTNSLRVGYLGPSGTFSEQALDSLPDLAGIERIPYSTVPDVFEAIESGEIGFGMVPIENSIEGTVNFTQDALVFDYNLLIQCEVVLDIEHCVLGRWNASVSELHTIYSIPIAAAQCRKYIRNNLREVVIRDANSTSDSARIAAESEDPGVGALAPRVVAEKYGLVVLSEDIGDHSENQTRFVLVARNKIPPRTGHDKTGIVVFQDSDAPGSLISILQEFAARRINLSNLSSRPTKKGGLGDYCFIIYAEGHIDDELVADALRNLRAKQGSVKFLGSYPATGSHAHGVREHADTRWREADDWVKGLRTDITR